MGRPEAAAAIMRPLTARSSSNRFSAASRAAWAFSRASLLAAAAACRKSPAQQQEGLGKGTIVLGGQISCSGVLRSQTRARAKIIAAGYDF
jgi:hypothetical protein